MYKYYYKTPSELSNIILLSDGAYLTGLYFETLDNKDKFNNYEEKDLDIFKETSKYLDIYFNRQIPSFIPKNKLDNISSFQKEVLDILLTIPYGEVITYGEIAHKISLKRNIKKMSSQAVGNAIGKNPLCIIIPCHRVIGINNNLVGYHGGLKNKIALLEIEGHKKEEFKYNERK
jgi:methylated-DNA-[protein]-cysteine S-methyltransferase